MQGEHMCEHSIGPIICWIAAGESKMASLCGWNLLTAIQMHRR